jgi:TRAP-type mannitol/chloroaromatic compound transport system substrate-binding protein
MVPEEDHTIGDYKGLKFRISGLGGRVVAKAGGTTILTPAAEIFASLERGVIDGAEWVGPHDDMKLSLHNTAPHYYFPGWHEPGTTNEFSFNKKAHEALPVDLQQTLDHAAAAVNVYGLTDYHTKNTIALERLKTEFKGKVEVLPLPAPVLRDLKKLAAEVVREGIREDPHGPEGVRVLHEVPGASGPLGPRRRRRLPSVRDPVRERPIIRGGHAPAPVPPEP